MNLTFEPIQKIDGRSAAQLLKTSIRDVIKKNKIQHPEATLKEEMASKQLDLESYFSGRGPIELCFVAKHHDQIVGIIGYGKPNTIIQDHFRIQDERTPEVKNVYVLPTVQKRGVGTFMFDKVLKLLQKKQFDAYFLDSGYQSSQKYWQKKIGLPELVLKDYWEKGYHHMIWKQKL
ncbi:MAG: GNAT family N-acetyltransferase [Saprospiraceae bacterium]|nr:GNAT family N-acetyltransferase [Saprospiraceae bacterium]